MSKDNQKQRYLYIDNLKLLMIIFVILLHTAVTFSGIGSWYVKDGEILDTLSTVFFGLFQSFTQAYFMGFLFLLSGYFVSRSYDKKGCKKFLTDRLIRLGIPTLIYMLIIHPFILYMLNYMDHAQVGKQYLHYIVSFAFVGASGPLWFALALLIFNCIYALIRVITKNSTKENNTRVKIPRRVSIYVLIALIAVAAFLIRLVQPIDTNILNMQLCFFAQYIVLFMVGVKAGRYDWFSQISYKMGRNWFSTVIGIGVPLWFILMVIGGALDGGFDLYKGGLTWQSAAYAAWESFVAVAMSIGLIGIFQERHNRQSSLIKNMSDSAFGVYVFHPPILIGVSMLFLHTELHPLLKFLGTGVIAIPLCFLFSYFIQKIHILNKVIY